MFENKFLLDNGLFLGQNAFKFSLPISFEKILTDMNRIRDHYAHRQDNEDASEAYIQGFFRVLGYQTAKKAPRLLSLTAAHADTSSSVLVLLTTPEESPEQTSHGLSLYTYLFYAANYYQARWGVVTNGHQLRILDFCRSDYQDAFFSADLDGIISNKQLEDFFTIYKIFHYMNSHNDEIAPRKRKQENNKDKQKLAPSSYDLSFLTQNIPQPTIALFEALRQKIFSLSASISERYTKLYVGYSSHRTFCVVEIKKSKISIFVNITIDDISDYSDYCEDVRQVGHHGIGDTKIVLQNPDDLDVVFEIIKQSYNKNS
jgi:predicted transport protein